MNPSYFSKELCDFVSKCLKKEPKERGNVEDLLQHEFISKYIGQENKIPEYLALLFDYMIIDS